MSRDLWFAIKNNFDFLFLVVKMSGPRRRRGMGKRTSRMQSLSRLSSSSASSASSCSPVPESAFAHRDAEKSLKTLVGEWNEEAKSQKGTKASDWNDSKNQETVLRFKRSLPPVSLSDLELFWFESGLITLQDLCYSLPEDLHWMMKLFYTWLERSQRPKGISLVDANGVLNLGGMLVSSKFPASFELEKYRPGALKSLQIPSTDLISTYFHDSMLLTSKDVDEIQDFMSKFPCCRFLCLKNNRIGFQQPKDQVSRAILTLLTSHPDLLIDLTGNPCVSCEYANALFSRMNKRQARLLQFLPKTDFEGSTWHSLFENNPDKEGVTNAVRTCHQWLFFGGDHP